MHREIHVYGNLIKYSLRVNKRSRHISIMMNNDGTISVTVPKHLPRIVRELSARKFVREKYEWISRNQKSIRQMDKLIPRRPGMHDYERYKEIARSFITKKVERWSERLDVSYNAIHIKRQKTAWGSCSSLKNLNFNYKLLFIPSRLSDYVVVHELCHLKEMNHGQRFWKQVEKQISDYKKRENELKLYRVLLR